MSDNSERRRRLEELREARALRGGVAPTRDRSFQSIAQINEFHRLNTATAFGILDEIFAAHQISGGRDTTIGLYRGQIEPSYILDISGHIIPMVAVLAEWGMRHNQE